VRALRAKSAGGERFATHAGRELGGTSASNADGMHKVGAFGQAELGSTNSSPDFYVIDYNHVFLHRWVLRARVFPPAAQKQTCALTSRATCVSIRDVEARFSYGKHGWERDGSNRPVFRLRLVIYSRGRPRLFATDFRYIGSPVVLMPHLCGPCSVLYTPTLDFAPHSPDVRRRSNATRITPRRAHSTGACEQVNDRAEVTCMNHCDFRCDRRTA
jgi:hypothetical protein